MHITHTDFLLAALTAPLALQLFIGLAGFGAFTLAAVSESQAEAQKKAFFNKFAKQISSMGVFLVIYVALAAVGSAVFLTMRHAAAFALWVENPMLSTPLAVALAATTALCLAYRATWQSLKNKPLHKLLGIGAVAGSWAVFFTSLAMKLFALKTPPDLVWPVSTSQVLGMARFACFWPLLLQGILLSMACAGSLGLAFAFADSGPCMVCLHTLGAGHERGKNRSDSYVFRGRVCVHRGRVRLVDRGHKGGKPAAPETAHVRSRAVPLGGPDRDHHRGRVHFSLGVLQNAPTPCKNLRYKRSCSS